MSDLLCDRDELGKVKEMFKSALNENGHISSLSCHNNSNTKVRRNRNGKYI